jgi:tRNA threonylcarbamoyladenosine modification (KEOPS) complex Cgi121 subunit
MAPDPGLGNKRRVIACFDLDREFDLTSIARTLPEGIVICSPMLVAGREHIDGILNQAEALWFKGAALARNKSIDLLMRITCRNQISDAIALSGLSWTASLAMFGLVNSVDEVRDAEKSVSSFAGRLERNDRSLLLDAKKMDYLKKLHSLPENLSADQIVVALKEKSVLLVFSK